MRRRRINKDYRQTQLYKHIYLNRVAILEIQKWINKHEQIHRLLIVVISNFQTEISNNFKIIEHAAHDIERLKKKIDINGSNSNPVLPTLIVTVQVIVLMIQLVLTLKSL